jgi:RNA-directed DNA polymerase
LIARLCDLTPRKSGQSVERTLAKINQVTTGWFTYFRHSNWNIFGSYDGMIRRPLRRQLLDLLLSSSPLSKLGWTHCHGRREIF